MPGGQNRIRPSRSLCQGPHQPPWSQYTAETCFGMAVRQSTGVPEASEGESLKHRMQVSVIPKSVPSTVLDSATSGVAHDDAAAKGRNSKICISKQEKRERERDIYIYTHKYINRQWFCHLAAILPPQFCSSPKSGNWSRASCGNRSYSIPPRLPWKGALTIGPS